MPIDNGTIHIPARFNPSRLKPSCLVTSRRFYFPSSREVRRVILFVCVSPFRAQLFSLFTPLSRCSERMRLSRGVMLREDAFILERNERPSVFPSNFRNKLPLGLLGVANGVRRRFGWKTSSNEWDFWNEKSMKSAIRRRRGRIPHDLFT